MQAIETIPSHISNDEDLDTAFPTYESALPAAAPVQPAVPYGLAV